MSTRCMILVEETYDGTGKSIPLYRHSDGYVIGAGSTIAEVLATSPPDAEALLAGLLAKRYDHDGTDGGPIHRAATWQPQEQGDLEYVYALQPIGEGQRIGTRNAVAGWSVKIYKRKDWQHDDFREWPAVRLSLSDLEAELVREQAAYDARVAEMRAVRAGQS